MREYTRNRSRFWLKIVEEQNYTNIYANNMVKSLAEKIAPSLTSYSPTGWKESKNHAGLFYLWIPDDQRDRSFEVELEKLETWAEQANQHIWLGTNRNTQNEFWGDEVDFCLASDWNIVPGTWNRTVVGEAEYQMKYNYPKRLVAPEDAKEYANILISAVLDCINCLPLNLSNYVVTTIPAVKDNQNKLAWQLAECIAKQLDAPFLKVTLLKNKPQMKEESIEDKIHIWRSIFDNKDMLNFSQAIRGKKILIVDDLYQSGASIWCFAEFLKNVYGVKKVIAITTVKALKDGDNQ